MHLVRISNSYIETACNSTCKTCNGTKSNNCLDCYEAGQNRLLKGRECVCKPGYEANKQLIC